MSALSNSMPELTALKTPAVQAMSPDARDPNATTYTATMGRNPEPLRPNLFISRYGCCQLSVGYGRYAIRLKLLRELPRTASVSMRFNIAQLSPSLPLVRLPTRRDTICLGRESRISPEWYPFPNEGD